MIDYKTVFQLAQDKGYKCNFEWDNPYKRTYKHLDDWKAIDGEIILANPKLALSELTLIQKWLRDEHKIHIHTSFNLGAKEWGGWSPVSSSLSYDNHERDMKIFEALENIYMDENTHLYTHESTLLEGIHEALKLI